MIREKLKKTSLILIASCLAIFSSKAQNLKISQYKMAPTFYNPATTGKFNGSFRAGAVYSNHETDSIALNHALAFADYKKEQEGGSVGFGISYYQNFGNNFSLTGKFLSASVAKHFYLDEDNYHMLSFGAQLTFANGTIDAAKKEFVKDISGGGFSMVKSATTKTSSYEDLNLGAMYTYNDDVLKIEAGFAAYHALAPNDKFKGKIPRRLVFTTNTNIAVDDNTELQLFTMFWKEGFSYDGNTPPLTENTISASLERFVGESTAFFIGMGTRSINTAIPLFGFSFNNNAIKVMASYEQTLHKRMYNVNRGEVSLMVTL